MRRRGFTLLEVMIGTMLVALVILSIYRFLQLNLTAMAAASEMSNRDTVLEALSAVLGEELRGLPGDLPGALQGENHKFKDLPSDEIEWLSTAGNGVFTRHASGQYRVRLMLRPVSKTGTELELGVRRSPVAGDGAEDGDAKGNWLRVLGEVAALEFRYFDVRINSWVEKWTDGNARPSLVRMRIWRTNERFPYEAIYALPPVRRPAEGQGG